MTGNARLRAPRGVFGRAGCSATTSTSTGSRRTTTPGAAVEHPGGRARQAAQVEVSSGTTEPHRDPGISGPGASWPTAAAAPGFTHARERAPARAKATSCAGCGRCPRGGCPRGRGGRRSRGSATDVAGSRHHGLGAVLAGLREERPTSRSKTCGRAREAEAHQVVGEADLHPRPRAVDGPQDPGGHLLRRGDRGRGPADVARIVARQPVVGVSTRPARVDDVEPAAVAVVELQLSGPRSHTPPADHIGRHSGHADVADHRADQHERAVLLLAEDRYDVPGEVDRSSRLVRTTVSKTSSGIASVRP